VAFETSTMRVARVRASRVRVVLMGCVFALGVFVGWRGGRVMPADVVCDVSRPPVHFRTASRAGDIHTCKTRGLVAAPVIVYVWGTE
jgi:hypothetical protein